jgi:hypothetical protein
MQLALPHPQTQKLTAVMTALAIAGLGGVAIVNSGDDGAADRPANAPAQVSDQMIGGQTPQQPGGQRP